ncbi:ArsR/SmtB family transcription factor [Arsenicicoccus sp. oral taxon 190]|uniref:ArsR/SmtB family transcription factor n=1 Tax=Arsenicicoccus sp. oral taxon 190 TaxID=1658671 RepID=UPI00067B4849|nr:helix-turn-helix domain-containing protein [Arsenicicoccus sp. oral taxon 190]
MPHPTTELRISDPRALRALAHPARQRLIDELYAGEVLTATEASRLVGLTPSATSYHLRALAGWGIVTRDEPSGDGRERPWRAAAGSLSVTPEAHRLVGPGDSRTLLDAWLGDLSAGLDRLSESVAGGGSGRSSRDRLWLTDDEYLELQRRLESLLRDYGAASGRTRQAHPEDARPWDVYALLLPAESRSAESPSAESRPPESRSPDEATDPA